MVTEPSQNNGPRCVHGKCDTCGAFLHNATFLTIAWFSLPASCYLQWHTHPCAVQKWEQFSSVLLRLACLLPFSSSYLSTGAVNPVQICAVLRKLWCWSAVCIWISLYYMQDSTLINRECCVFICIGMCVCIYMAKECDWVAAGSSSTSTAQSQWIFWQWRLIDWLDLAPFPNVQMYRFNFVRGISNFYKVSTNLCLALHLFQCLPDTLEHGLLITQVWKFSLGKALLLL